MPKEQQYEKYELKLKENKMVLSEDASLLQEMATLCRKEDGYGIVIRIQSNDHDPAHAHLLTTDLKEISRFLITDNKPTKYSDVKEYKGDPEISPEYKKKIIKWIKDNHKRTGVNNWKRLWITWDATANANK